MTGAQWWAEDAVILVQGPGYVTVNAVADGRNLLGRVFLKPYPTLPHGSGGRASQHHFFLASSSLPCCGLPPWGQAEV